MEAKEPEKKIPSTAAKATRRCANVEFLSWIHLMAHSAFLRIQGTEEDISFLHWCVLEVPSLTGVNCVEKIGALLLLFDVGVNEKRVCLRVDVFHHDLKAIEASRLRYLDLSAETFHQVLIDNAIRGGEEGKDVGDEVTLVVIQTIVPIVQILGKIDFLGSPERCLGFLVHLPDL